MTSFGNIGEYEPAAEPWIQYTERLDQFFVANAITDGDRKRAIFLTVIGPSTYALLRNLLSPAAPTAKTLAELIQALSAHFDPAPSEIVERFKFNTRMRSVGESVADFIAELRRLAKHCNFGVALDEMLRDRIVCGIQDEAMQRKLLAEGSLTLKRATEIALAMEAAARDANNLKISARVEVNKINHYRNGGKKEKSEGSQATVFQRSGPKDVQTTGSCGRCGDRSHRSNECRFLKSVCHSCGKTGHISKVCRSKAKRKGKVNNLQVAQVTEESKQSEVYTLYSLKAMDRAIPPAKAICTVQGKKICFEVDSGAPFTLMPVHSYNEIKKNLPPLQPSDIRLQSFTQHSIKVLGSTEVDVVFEGNACSLPLLIVEQGSVNLAGRNWIYPLKLMEVFQNQDKYRASLCQISQAPRTELSIKVLLKKFEDLFSPGLGRIKGVKVHLTKKPDAAPKFFKARPVPYALREKVEEEICRLVKEGILEPVKTAEFAAPIVPVVKQNGKIRICGDFKVTTNKVTELEQYPLPKIEDLFAKLSGGKSFSRLDLRDAYYQLELDEQSKELVVINTLKGLYRYTSLPNGVASAPAIFQREMEKILQGLDAEIYLDDMLVTGKDEEEHLRNLNAVFTRLQEAGIKLHPDKCEFLKDSVEYLGHRIDKHGLHPVESKVEAIVRAPDPKNVDELRSFLGLITYYAKFLPNMATLLAPLYKLLEIKQIWKWGSEEKETFEKVKKTLQNSSLLVHFDNNKEVILACDASPYGLGAVLSHETSDGERPIAFASRTLSKAERNYSHIEKEALALVFGVTKFRNYLLGRDFTLLTDHRPLVSLLSEDKPIPSVAAARIQRWALTLSAYSYKIRFRKGKLHSNADACSRLPLEGEYEAEDPPLPTESVLFLQQLDDTPVTKHLIATEIEKNPDLKKLKSYIQTYFPKKIEKHMSPFLHIKSELSVEDGVILRGTRIFIPPKFTKFILHELHSSHQGISATKALARSYVWWPGIDSDIEKMIKGCSTCQINATAPPAKPVSWPVPKEAWERIHIDHAGPVEGHMLLIVVDAKTRWLEVSPVPSVSANATITMLRSLFARLGIPISLVSDNGPGFRSDEFAKFLKKNGISHVRTAPFHPCSNGLAERAVRTVKTALKKMTDGPLTQRLCRFLLNYRITPSAATGISPAEAMFGRKIRTRLDLVRDDGHQTSEKKEVPQRTTKFNDGVPVWVRSYGRGPKWVPGSVLRLVGNVMYSVETAFGVWRRHQDQIRLRDETKDCVPRLPEQTRLPETSVPATPLPRCLAQPGIATVPPVLSPQVSDIENSVTTNPPVLSPQVISQPSPATPQVRRSVRMRRQPVRLEL